MFVLHKIKQSFIYTMSLQTPKKRKTCKSLRGEPMKNTFMSFKTLDRSSERIRNATYVNNGGKTNYTCSHLEFTIDVKYCLLARLYFYKGPVLIIIGELLCFIFLKKIWTLVWLHNKGKEIDI